MKHEITSFSIGHSWLVPAASVANELTAHLLNPWSAFAVSAQHTFRNPPQLHLYRSPKGKSWHALVQQHNFLHAHSNSSNNSIRVADQSAGMLSETDTRKYLTEPSNRPIENSGRVTGSYDRRWGGGRHQLFNDCMTA